VGGVKYRTIVADPPWRYTQSRGLPTRGRKHPNAEAHYLTMSMPEIAAMPVAAIADADAHLYLWATMPRLFADRSGGGIGPRDVMEAWGFRYVTCLVWVKQGAPGLGWYFRGDAELVLFGVRGDMRIPAHLRRSNVIVAPRTGHSRKPEAFYDLVETVSPDPRVELFARNHQRLGWDTFGNEAFNHVELGEAAS
jgi:N6-adenosine-specific RNA methylase IME4